MDATCPECKIVLKGLDCICVSNEPKVTKVHPFDCPDCHREMMIPVEENAEVTCSCGLGFRQRSCSECGKGLRIVPRNMFKYRVVCYNCGAVLRW